MRLTLSDNQMTALINSLEFTTKYSDLLTYIKLEYEKELNKDKSKKVNATKLANKSKIDKSKKLVQDAINILNLEGKKINASTISKQAGINYNTASKYLKIINL